MERTRVDDVVAQVYRFLAGELSREELQDWLVPLVWDPDLARVDPQTDDLVHSIQLELSEFTGGHLTAAELREHLRELLPMTASVFVSYDEGEPHYSLPAYHSGSSPQETSRVAATMGGPIRVDFTPPPSYAGT